MTVAVKSILPSLAEAARAFFLGENFFRIRSAQNVLTDVDEFDPFGFIS